MATFGHNFWEVGARLGMEALWFIIFWTIVCLLGALVYGLWRIFHRRSDLNAKEVLHVRKK